MFQLYDRFGFRTSGKNDILLSDDEVSIIENEFIPNVSEQLFEARGRISLIEGTPRPEEVIRAIKNRNYISVFYKHRNGEKGHRLIEPYAFGKGLVTNNGTIVNQHHYYLRGFVIMNSNTDKTTKGRFTKTKSVSVSDKRNRWRMFRLDRMLKFTNMEKVFSQYRRQYNPNDKHLATILSSLPYSSFPKGENPKVNW